MKNIFAARDFEVPSDLPERLDSVTDEKPGTFRNMMADMGNLHEIEKWAFATSLSRLFNEIMQMDDIQFDNKMSLSRLSNTLWSVMFSYCLGTMKIDKHGFVHLGEIEDIAFVNSIMSADDIRFRTGKTMSLADFLKTLKVNTDEDCIKDIYKEVYKRRGSLKKTIVPSDMFKLAMTAINTADRIMKD